MGCIAAATTLLGTIGALAQTSQPENAASSPTSQPASTISPRVDSQHKAEQKALAAAQEYIDQLADPDPTVRQNATTMLIAQGAAARPAMLGIMDSDNPEVQFRARLILSMLPWARNSDTIGVKTLLRRYGSLPYYQQLAFIESLEGRSDQSAVQTKLRILAEEMNPKIQWKIVEDIAHNPQDFPSEQLQQISLYSRRSAVLLAQAMGYNGLDNPQMLKRIELGLDAELDQADTDPTAVFLLDQYGMDCARYQNDPVAAQRVARKVLQLSQRISRNSGFASDLSKSLQLISIHVEFPLLDGLEEDVRMSGTRVMEPAVLHAWAEAYDARGNVIVGSAFHAAALYASPLDIESHGYAGSAMFEYGMIPSSLMELDLTNRYIKAAENSSAESARWRGLRSAIDSLAYFQTTILINQGKYEKALGIINDLKTRRDKLIPPGQNEDDDTILNDMQNLLLLHVATEKGNPTLATAALNDLVQEKSSDPDKLKLALPLLRQLGRDADANQLFQEAYQSLTKEFEKTPNSPEAQNAVAWLLVQCNEKLPEARKRSEAAVKANPINGATVDTLAAVCFAQGDARRAAELEEIALRLRPGDLFIANQLAKFRAAANLQQPH